VKEAAFNPRPDWIAEHAMDIVQAAVQCYVGARQMSGATPYPALNAVSGCASDAVNPDPNGPN
jgi:hypothetical protein